MTVQLVNCRLRIMRNTHGYSQQKLEHVSGICGRTIRELENGRRLPRFETAKKLADALASEIQDIWPEDAHKIVQSLQPKQLKRHLEVGIRIQEKRKSTGLTQTALARKGGFSVAALRNWEKGYALPEGYNAFKLTTVLHCGAEELFGGEKISRAPALNSDAERLRQLRKKIGLSQTEVASRLGVTSTSISGYELGIHKVPHLRKQPLAAILQASLNDIWQDSLAANDRDSQWDEPIIIRHSGDMVKSARIAKQMSRIMLKEATGVSVKVITRWEEANTKPLQRCMKAILSHLDLRWEEVLGDDFKKPPYNTGNKIAYHRNRAGFTLAQLGKEVGVTRQRIFQLEHSAADKPNGEKPELLTAIAKVLQVSEDELWARA